MTDKITISIPRDLKQKLEKKIKDTDFKSIQEYIVYILKEVIFDSGIDSGKQAYTEEEEAAISGPKFYNEKERAYTEEEEAALKKNLEDLGYL